MGLEGFNLNNQSNKKEQGASKKEEVSFEIVEGKTVVEIPEYKTGERHGWLVEKTYSNDNVLLSKLHDRGVMTVPIESVKRWMRQQKEREQKFYEAGPPRDAT